MKRESYNIKKIIKRRIKLSKQTKMNERNKIRTSGKPKPIDVGLVNRNEIRLGRDYNLNKRELLDFNYVTNNLSDKNISIIFSYKESSYDRKRNLKEILNFFSYYLSDNVEIIIVEQGIEININWLNEIKNNQFIKHIFLKNKNIFNKGWGFNVGAKHAKGDYLIFNDSDVLVSSKTYQVSLNLLNEYDIVNPYKYIYWLNELETIDFISKEDKSKTLLNRKKFVPSVITGGIFLIKKDKFFKLKGFDENSYGWGYQDYIFDEKVKKTDLKIIYIKSTALHLHHEGSTKPGVNNYMSTDIYFSFKERNKIIYELYQNMTKKEILNKIKNIKKFGEGGIEL